MATDLIAFEIFGDGGSAINEVNTGSTDKISYLPVTGSLRLKSFKDTNWIYAEFPLAQLHLSGPFNSLRSLDGIGFVVTRISNFVTIGEVNKFFIIGTSSAYKMWIQMENVKGYAGIDLPDLP